MKKNFTRKLISIVTILVVLVGSLFSTCTQVQAAEKPKLETQMLYYSDGKVGIQIYLRNCEDVGGLSFKIKYDKEKFAYNGEVEKSNLVNSSLLSINEQDGVISVGLVNMAGLQCEWDVLTFKFDSLVSGPVALRFPIEVTDCTDLYASPLTIEYDSEGYHGEWHLEKSQACNIRMEFPGSNEYDINDLLELECGVENYTDIYSYEFTLEYPADVIEYSRYELISGLNALVDIHMLEEGKLRVAIVSTELLPNVKKLITLKFITRKATEYWENFKVSDIAYVDAQLQEKINERETYAGFRVLDSTKSNLFLVNGQTSVSAGGRLDVKLELKENAGFNALTLELDYDEAIFEYLDGVCVDEMLKGAITNVSTEDGKVTIAVAAMDTITADGEFATISFKVKEVIAQETTLSLNMIEFVDGSMKTLESVCGTHTVDIKGACKHTTTTTTRQNEVAATCTVDGKYDEVKTCSECGKEISRQTKTVAAKGHSYDAGVITKQPTVTEEGEKTYTCTVCGYKKIEKLPKGEAPTTITSSTVSVDANTKYISKITVGMKVSELLNAINEGKYVEIRKAGEVQSADTVVGTGMTACVVSYGAVVAEYTIVVTGDTNGDGKINITDMIATKAHILKKTLLAGAQEKGGDVNGDGKINITDFIKIKATLLKKDSIIGVTAK